MARRSDHPDSVDSVTAPNPSESWLVRWQAVAQRLLLTACWIVISNEKAVGLTQAEAGAGFWARGQGCLSLSESG